MQVGYFYIHCWQKRRINFLSTTYIECSPVQAHCPCHYLFLRIKVILVKLNWWLFQSDLIIDSNLPALFSRPGERGPFRPLETRECQNENFFLFQIKQWDIIWFWKNSPSQLSRFVEIVFDRWSHLKYWPHLARPASFFKRFSFALLHMTITTHQLMRSDEKQPVLKPNLNNSHVKASVCGELFSHVPCRLRWGLVRVLQHLQHQRWYPCRHIVCLLHMD